MSRQRINTWFLKPLCAGEKADNSLNGFRNNIVKVYIFFAILVNCVKIGTYSNFLGKGPLNGRTDSVKFLQSA